MRFAAETVDTLFLVFFLRSPSSHFYLIDGSGGALFSRRKRLFEFWCFGICVCVFCIL